MSDEVLGEASGIWMISPLAGSLRWSGPLGFGVPAVGLAAVAWIAVDVGTYGLALFVSFLTAAFVLLGVAVGTWRPMLWVGGDRTVMMRWSSLFSRSEKSLGTLARVRVNRRSEIIFELESGKRLLLGGFASRAAAIDEAKRLASFVPVSVDEQ